MENKNTYLVLSKKDKSSNDGYVKELKLKVDFPIFGNKAFNARFDLVVSSDGCFYGFFRADSVRVSVLDENSISKRNSTEKIITGVLAEKVLLPFYGNGYSQSKLIRNAEYKEFVEHSNFDLVIPSGTDFEASVKNINRDGQSDFLKSSWIKFIM